MKKAKKVKKKRGREIKEENKRKIRISIIGYTNISKKAEL